MVQTRSRSRPVPAPSVVRAATKAAKRKAQETVRLATGYGERCPNAPHTVDCSLVDDPAPGQRERCVTDEAD